MTLFEGALKLRANRKEIHRVFGFAPQLCILHFKLGDAPLQGINPRFQIVIHLSRVTIIEFESLISSHRFVPPTPRSIRQRGADGISNERLEIWDEGAATNN